MSARVEQWIHGHLCRIHDRLTSDMFRRGPGDAPPGRALRAVRFAIDVIETRWIWGWRAAFDVLRGRPTAWDDHAPRVCPGCYALDDEPCAAYCPDAAIERDREDARDAALEAAEDDYGDLSGEDWP